MAKCHACQSELDDTSLAAGKCRKCGAPLRNLPRRNIEDATHEIDPSEELPGTEPPEVPLAPGERTMTLEELESLELFTDEPESEESEKDTSSKTHEHQETLIVGEGEVEEPGDPHKTVAPDEADLADLSDIEGEEDLELDIEEKTPEDEGGATIAFAPDQTLDFTDLVLSEDDAKEDEEEENGKGGATVAFSPDKTVDFTGPVSGDDTDSLVTANWESKVEGDVKDSRSTIKQTGTVSGNVGTKSSVVVKSRQFHSGRASGDQIISPSDAPDYELLNVIGEGGMGVVYAARQSAIARTVAVKMLKGEDAGSLEQREKFISEAVVTGELDHPNIVPIYDLGSNDAGALFYSMKRVKGTPWNKVIEEKSLDENINILLRVADAVAFAHANGVVHRDLKPENTMLGDYGEVLVMDWGLARISPDFPNADSVSQSDVMGGTPAYMAPEMATGPIEKVTIASDIYLLGAMLYEIIEGRTPHSGSTVMACLFAAAKNKVPTPLNPGELADIAFKAMATKPEDRYLSVREFQEAIRQYQSHSESIVLTDSAMASLSEAREKDDYDLFSRAMYGFQEAVSMWSGNHRAKKLHSESRVSYASSALDRGDFELGLSLLNHDDPDHADIVTKLESGRKDRQRRHRLLQLFKGLVAALVLAVIGIVGYAYLAVSEQRDIANEQRDLAVVAKQDAETQRDRAEEQEKLALKQKELADRERIRAEEAEDNALEQKDKALAAEADALLQKDKAVAAEAEAVEQRDIAKEQKRLAEEAKRREEYEAYVAQIGLASAKIDENSFDRAQQLLEECSEQLSQWEWGRLAYLCQLSEATWRLGGPVEEVAYSPDGKYFVTGDQSGKVTLFDSETKELLVEHEHSQYVHAVAFDPEGRKFASASSDGTIRVYGAPVGDLLQELSGHTDGVVSLCFSADGRKLLSGSYDNTSILWNLTTSSQIQRLRGHSWWVRSAQFSPDNERIVTVGEDGKAVVWQRTTKAGPYEIQTEFIRHRGPIHAAKFSPNGKLIATAGVDGRVLLWNPDQVQKVDIARRIDDLPDPPAPYREFIGHQKAVHGLDFSPDGERLVSASEDNVVRIWQVRSGEEVANLRGHTSYVLDCQFSPDGSQILSAGRDQQVKLWNPATYGESLALGRNEGAGHDDAVLAARFSVDGNRVVTASSDRSARLWDAKTQGLVNHFAEGHEFLTSSAVFFAGGQRLATSAGDGSTRIWNVAAGTEIEALVGTGRTAAIDISPDGLWMAAAGTDYDLQIWDLQKSEIVAHLKGHVEPITAVAFSANGKLLATGDERGRGRIWNLNGDKWQPGPWLEGHSRTITGLRFAQQGQKLVTASVDNTCGQWDVQTGQELRSLVLKHPGWVTGLDVSDDGALAMTICGDGNLRLWSLETAQVLRTIEPAGNLLFTSVDISPGGDLAIAACAEEATVQMWQLNTGEEVRIDGQPWLDLGDRSGVLWSAQFTPLGDQLLTVGGNDAQLWDVSSGRRIHRFTPHGTVASADISPDGRLVVTGSWDASAKIWDVASGKAILKLDGVHEQFVNSVAFSPDGKLVLTASDDRTARFWNVSTGQTMEPVLRGHESRIYQARFNDDGSKVITTSGDKTALIWDARSGESLVELNGHQWGVLCGEFSPDGKLAITGSEDDDAIIWNAHTGELVRKLSGHTSSVMGVAFSPDGRRVLTGSLDGLCKLWDAETGKEILTLDGQNQEITSVSFSPDGLSVLTSDQNGQTRIWPALDWRNREQRLQAAGARLQQ